MNTTRMTSGRRSGKTALSRRSLNNFVRQHPGVTVVYGTPDGIRIEKPAHAIEIGAVALPSPSETGPGVMLTLDEIRNLQTGDRVRVTWSGGNGPHVYTIERTDNGSILASTDGLPPGYPGSLYDALSSTLAKVAIHKVEKITTRAPSWIGDDCPPQWRRVGTIDVADPAEVQSALARGRRIGAIYDGGSFSVAEPCAADIYAEHDDLS